jgi:chemotaxis protein CheC
MVKSYEDLNELQLDAIREVASIGSGNAATALSSLLNQPVKISVPRVELMDYDKAMSILGGPETIAGGIMVRLTGDMKGIILYLQELNFINLILESVFSKKIGDYGELGEMETSALIEIGNIGISSYINSLTAFAGMDVQLSVPAFNVNMAGAMISVPMAEIGYESNKMMLLDGTFWCSGNEVSSKLLLVPDVNSLNELLIRLGVEK